MYSYEIAYNEMVRLERNAQTGKVDHRPKEAKTFLMHCGCCYHCANEQISLPSIPVRGVLDKPISVEEK